MITLVEGGGGYTGNICIIYTTLLYNYYMCSYFRKESYEEKKRDRLIDYSGGYFLLGKREPDVQETHREAYQKYFF